MFALIWLGGPAALAALLTIVMRARWSRAHVVVFGIGVALAVGFVLLAYLQAPPDYEHSGGDSDGEMFLGRWWEPQFVAFLVFVGYVFWASASAPAS